MHTGKSRCKGPTFDRPGWDRSDSTTGLRLPFLPNHSSESGQAAGQLEPWTSWEYAYRCLHLDETARVLTERVTNREGGDEAKATACSFSSTRCHSAGTSGRCTGTNVGDKTAV